VPPHKEASVPTSVFPDLLLLSFFLHNIVHITLSHSYALVLNVIKFTWLNASHPVTTEGKNDTLQYYYLCNKQKIKHLSIYIHPFTVQNWHHIYYIMSCASHV
jgi:hypothetical protein